MKKTYLIYMMIVALTLVLSACGNDDKKEAGATKTSENGIELGEESLSLPYVTWASSEAGTFVAKSVLEDIGYEIDLEQVEAGILFSGIADGSLDFSVGTATLPTTHKDYWDEYKDKIDDINISMDKSVTIGLAVPEYMDIDSLEDLRDNTNNVGDELDWKIVGIDPGAGEMEIAEQEVIPGYDLDDWNLESSSDAAMTAELKDAIENEEPVIVTLWEPHWAFIEWNLKYLEDPQNLFGEPNSLHAIGREGLEEDAPAAHKMLSQFEWTAEDMGEVMVDINNDMDPEDAAEKWLDDNQDKVDEWTEGI